MTVDPEDLTDQELEAAISQLQGEAAMPGPTPQDELDAHKKEAQSRGLNQWG